MYRMQNPGGASGKAAVSLLTQNRKTVAMKAGIEKRKTRRYRCTPPLTYQLTVFDRPFDAKGADHSEEGIAFNSDDRIKPGTIIFLKHRDCRQCTMDRDNCKGCRTATFATVKWCREYARMDSRYYKIGAKYLVPDGGYFF